jgi:general secretion pathway protein K
LGQVLAVNGVNLQIAANILNNLGVNTSTSVTGRINLNTASEAVLNSIPGMTPDMTSAILTRQQDGFQGIGDLTSVPGVDLNWLQQTADQFVVGSSTFRVRAVGTWNGVQVGIEALVSIEDGQPVLKQISDMPFSDMTARWGWVETTTADIVLAEAE